MGTSPLTKPPQLKAQKIVNSKAAWGPLPHFHIIFGSQTK